ncbi:MAG: GDSL-type esterase/lipase family protein [Planctomycetes bacterium]|nr:GDSL-type esterase/lipase family protein [Planctomycetota bacterium]
MNRHLSRALLVSVLSTACGLANLFTACGSTTHASEPARSSAAQDTHRFESEIAAFETWDRQNSWPRDAILFVGSSSIRLWQTAESFPDLPVVNRGFGGSEISDVNHYFDRIVAKYKPRAIVFYSGDNDIAAGKSPQQVYDDFLEFVRLVRERLGKTRIYFLSIKPSIARLKMWPQMKEANKYVWRLAGINDQVVFVDIATPMLDGNNVPIRKLFLDDGLHLNADGYKLWNKTLAPLLQTQPPTGLEPAAQARD